MEDKEEATSNTTQKQPKICDECKLNPSKYKCPGCSVRSCSLPCINAHKQRTGCNGKRKLTEPVPLSQFDENRLISDYNMLEEAKRVADVAERTRAKISNHSYTQYKLPYYLVGLRIAASFRKVKLLFLPSGMSKREKNKTRYDRRKRDIYWTIEWRFYSADVVLLDHEVHEDRNLRSVVENHLQPSPWKNPLRQFTEEQLDSLKFFVRKNPKGPKSPFRELDINAPIRQQFSDLVILEYPVIHVFLPTHRYDFEVVKDAIPVTPKPDSKDSVGNDAPSPSLNDTPFREEEIKGDGISADPPVFDLTKNVNSSPASQIPHQDSKPEKSLMNSSEKPLKEGAAGTSSGSNLAKSAKQIDFDKLGFEFDQGIIDAFAKLIAECNPDDYLDLDSGYDLDDGFAEDELAAGTNLSGSGEVAPVEDELEEGEIRD